MKAADKILKAKVQLILEQPFFATLALLLQYEPDPNIKTASTNGETLTYNPGYVDELTIDETKGLIAHEVFHMAMLHHTRRDNRDVKAWNRATDYAINPMLAASGFALPAGYLSDDRYLNKSAEQIYQLLPASDEKSDTGDHASNTGNKNENGIGEVADAPPGKDTTEIEANMKQTLAQAALIAKRQGKLPAHLERLVTEMLQPRINWQEVLARFIAELSRNDYTWSKPAPRYLHMDLYLPALESTETGKIILIADTSASVDEVLINQFAAEVQAIAHTFNIPLQIIYVDAAVQDIQNIDTDEPVQLKPSGGGGTDFRPGFLYIEQHDLQPKAVVYLTDGDCSRFPSPPDYQVLWAQFGDDVDFQPPFGETIQII
ncbi:vWA domain-containing protein [Chitinophaga cymbidii]|uniref:Hydrolase n=1 Tax=Chitinophaga cymbidii TaxID=1096750 RepID=A0A512RPR2_9BACT|nr:VWA-like domain-containing protein [Chitinophaga cymbidii]GEP97685.1 hydrolase [Chitinophaga cymbidii]